MEEILKRGLISLLVIVIVLLVYYILKGILLTKLGKLKGDKKVWFAWIPILSTYYLGKLTVNKIVGAALVLLNILTSSGSFTNGDTTINVSFLSLLPNSISIIITYVNLIINIGLLIYSVVLIKKLKTRVKETSKEEPIQKIEELELSANNEDIEILDLSNEEKINNTLEQKKENKLTLIILSVILVFVMLLPTISNIFNRKDTIIDNTKPSEIKYNETNDTYLEIGSLKGNIVAKNIQFYDFEKKDNKITYKYLPQDEIKNVNDLNLFIELYDEKNSVIYRRKFTSNDALSRKIIINSSLDVNKNIYNSVKYAKVVILNDADFSNISNILVCKQVLTEAYYNVENKTTYNFSKNGLSNMEVEENFTKLTQEDDQIFKEAINKIVELLKDSIKDVEVTDTSIKFKTDLTTLKSDDFIPTYTLGTTINEIKTNEENNNWSCSNE